MLKLVRDTLIIHISNEIEGVIYLDIYVNIITEAMQKSSTPTTYKEGDSGLMSNIEIVQNFIDSTNDLYCDDCLSEGLNIKPRQQINQICNKFQKQGFIKRELKQCCYCSNDKLVNLKISKTNIFG